MAQSIVYGSVDRPVSLDHFQVIREVHWVSGRIGIVTIKYDELNRYDVQSIVPPDGVTEGLAGDHITAGYIVKKDDYKEKQILALPIVGSMGTLHAEDEISPTYVGNGSTTVSGYVTKENDQGKTPGLDIFHEAVASLSNTFGRPPDMSVIGAIIEAVFTTHTHPDGSKVTYISGWTSKTFTLPDFDWTDSASAVWYTVGSIPAREAAILQQSWLINFSSRNVDGVKTPYITRAGIHATSGALQFNTTYSLQMFQFGTEFTLKSDGTVEANKAAIKTETGTSPPSADGIIRQIDQTGFTT
jgi:hypothetical protein